MGGNGGAPPLLHKTDRLGADSAPYRLIQEIRRMLEPGGEPWLLLTVTAKLTLVNINISFWEGKLMLAEAKVILNVANININFININNNFKITFPRGAVSRPTLTLTFPTSTLTLGSLWPAREPFGLH